MTLERLTILVRMRARRYARLKLKQREKQILKKYTNFSLKEFYK
jgi:hypothetical protein